MLKKKIWANFQRIIELFTKKIVKKLLKIWSWDPGSGIRDPGSGIRDPEKIYSGSRIQGSKSTQSRIPDPDPQHWPEVQIADPDPDQNVTDPHHWLESIFLSPPAHNSTLSANNTPYRLFTAKRSNRQQLMNVSK